MTKRESIVAIVGTVCFTVIVCVAMMLDQCHKPTNCPAPAPEKKPWVRVQL
jgi:hypothetical protein